MATTETRTVFRSEISNNRLGAALIAGAVAVHIATIFGYWFHGFNLPDLKYPDFNGVLLVGKDASPLAQFWAGSLTHMMTGLCWAILFAFMIHPRLPLPNTRGGNILKALIFAFVLATLSGIWWVPQLFNSVYSVDLGWFSQNVGKVFFGGTATWKVIFAIYLWHGIWGLTLGMLYNPTNQS